MGWGGFSRNGPIGGSAYGIPLNESTPRRLDPTTVAYSSSTVGVPRLSWAGAATARGIRQTARPIEDHILLRKPVQDCQERGRDTRFSVWRLLHYEDLGSRVDFMCGDS